jgi:hypothetical protein
MGPVYEGPNLSKIAVTGGLFNEMGFGTFFLKASLSCIDSICPPVVMSDPKSRTGEQDKKQMCEL